MAMSNGFATYSFIRFGDTSSNMTLVLVFLIAVAGQIFHADSAPNVDPESIDKQDLITETGEPAEIVTTGRFSEVATYSLPKTFTPENARDAIATTSLITSFEKVIAAWSYFLQTAKELISNRACPTTKNMIFGLQVLQELAATGQIFYADSAPSVDPESSDRQDVMGTGEPAATGGPESYSEVANFSLPKTFTPENARDAIATNDFTLVRC